MVTGASLDSAVLAMLGLALLAALVRWVLLPSQARRAGRDWLRAQRALLRARRRSAAAVGSAQLRVWWAERRRTSAIAAMDRRIVELEDPRGRRIDGFESVLLHEFRIITPAGEVGLEEVRATVDTAGALSETKRATLTRLALGGLVLGPLGAVLALGFQKRRTIDHRELYLLIEAGAASCVLQIGPDAGPRVRAFAMQINAAATSVSEVRERRTAELTAARASRTATHGDLTDLERARTRLAAARSDPRLQAAVMSARGAVAEARERWERAAAGR
jgi:hypothetical protein